MFYCSIRKVVHWSASASKINGELVNENKFVCVFFFLFMQFLVISYFESVFNLMIILSEPTWWSLALNFFQFLPKTKKKNCRTVLFYLFDKHNNNNNSNSFYLIDELNVCVYYKY